MRVSARSQAPATLASMNSLAGLLMVAGKQDEAERLLRESMDALSLLEKDALSLLDGK